VHDYDKTTKREAASPESEGERRRKTRRVCKRVSGSE